jgi:putative membrane protein
LTFFFEGLSFRAKFSSWVKAQSVDFRQSFFQKRRGLASLRVNNASGQMNIPYIPEDVAYKLMNYLLYRVEAANKKWM